MKKEYYGLLAGVSILLIVFAGVFGKAIFSSETNSSLTNNIQSNNKAETTSSNLIYDDNIVAASLKVPLTIKNVQNSTDVFEYTYDITIEDVAGAIETKINDKTEYIVFDSKGYTQIKLKSNSTITLYDLPLDVKYTIKQSKNDTYQTQIDGEKTTYISGTLTLENNITFENIAAVVKENPKTADPIVVLVILLVLASIILIVLTNYKYFKFNSELI